MDRESPVAILRREVINAKERAKKAFTSKANARIAAYSGIKGKVWDYNFGFALIEIMVSASVAQEPSFTAHPLNRQGELIAPVQEQFLKHYCATLKLREKAWHWLLWSYVTGLGVMKLGFYQLRVAQVGERAGLERVSEGQPFVDYVDPRAWFVDPYCARVDLSDARFCGDTVVKSIEELKASGIYDLEVLRELKPQSIAVDYDDDMSRIDRISESYGMVLLDEVQSRNFYTGGLELAAFAENETRPLRPLTALDPAYKQFGYIPLQFFPRLGKFYGQSILEVCGAVLDQIDNVLKRVALKWQKAPQKILARLQELMRTKGDASLRGNGVFDVVDTGDLPPELAVKLLQAEIISASELQYLGALIDEFHRISGISYIQMGMGSSRTATEAGAIQRSSDLRTSRRLDIAESAVSEIGSRLWQMGRLNRENMPVNEILDPENVERWEEYERMQSAREKTENDTDLTVRMALPVNAGATFRRDRMIELLRNILANPVIIQLLQMENKRLKIGVLIDKITTDSGQMAPLTEEIQPQEQGQPVPVGGE